MTTQNRNAAPDVVRGIAILSVVLYHATMTLGHHLVPVKAADHYPDEMARPVRLDLYVLPG